MFENLFVVVFVDGKLKIELVCHANRPTKNCWCVLLGWDDVGQKNRVDKVCHAYVYSIHEHVSILYELVFLFSRNFSSRF